MLYVDFTADKDYKLRLTTRSLVELEKKLGCNPLTIFGSGDRIPTITELVIILHASLQAYHHGISLDDTYDIFDKYLEYHPMTDFITVVLDIYRASGLVSKEDSEKK
jgi:hypothetical protein